MRQLSAGDVDTLPPTPENSTTTTRPPTPPIPLTADDVDSLPAGLMRKPSAIHDKEGL